MDEQEWGADIWKDRALNAEAKIINLLEELVLAKAAIQGVRELHRMHCGSCKECIECNYLMPCPTLVALNTATWLRSLTDGGTAHE